MLYTVATLCGVHAFFSVIRNVMEGFRADFHNAMVGIRVPLEFLLLRIM
jgi:hypothetical protein